MKAIVCSRYGPPEVLHLEEVPQPEPEAHEVLIRIQAAPLTRADCMMRAGTPYYARLFLGLRGPKKPIPGTGFAGVVESVGSAVSSFQSGDPVFGETGVAFGTYAELVAIPEESLLMPLPEFLSFEEAAPLCDGILTAWNFLINLAGLQEGQSLLVNGAAGSLGMAAVQIGQHCGAQVTGVCSPGNAEQVRSLGASHIVDYHQEDFTQQEAAFDVIFDTQGKRSFSSCRRALKPQGMYLSPVLSMGLLFQVLRTSRFGKQRALFSATGLKPVPELKRDLETILPPMEQGRIKTVISRTFSLEQVPEAHRLIESGHKRGNVLWVAVPN